VNDQNKINPGHGGIQAVCRVVGPLILVTGILLTVTGILLAAIGMFCFICFAFLGLPLVFVGTLMTFAGFMGRIARYTQAEMAPVARDTFNYMADGTQDGIRTVATAIGQGVGAGISAAGANAAPPGHASEKVRCHKCNHLQDAGAKFCSTCGVALEKTKSCTQCSELNDPDARFCDNCGYSF